MGLDMYAFWRHPNDSTDENIEFCYWRKHNRLHGFMEQLYRERGGEDVFNCVELRLHEADLDRIATAVIARELPATSGFFFGGDSYEYYPGAKMRNDLNFIAEARGYIRNGLEVYYDSWW